MPGVVTDEDTIPDRPAAMHVLSLYTMLTEASDRAEEEDGTSDALEEELLSYDPATIVQEEVVYDGGRLEKLLTALRAEDFKLTSSQRRKAEKIIAKHQKAFNLKGEPLGCTSMVQHRVDTAGAQPVRQKLRFTPYHARPALEKELESLLQQGQIRPSTSPWNSAIVLVKRKDGRIRLCTDYRGVNQVTVPTWYPLPLIEDILYTVSGAVVYSCLDLRSGYHQIKIDPDSIPKTAFSTHLGQFVYTRMPFGLCGSPATFQALMNVIFRGLLGKGVAVFLDDICVSSENVDEHLTKLETVLARLEGANLQISPEKTFLFQHYVQLLGHQVGHGSVRPVDDKVEAIAAL